MSVVTKFPPGPTHKMPGKLLRQFIHDPINTLSNIAREYGDISYFKLGREHVYLINNPDYIEKVLIYDHSNFKKGKRLQTSKDIWRSSIHLVRENYETYCIFIISPDKWVIPTNIH
ncbi:MAG TPA: cytochrome P450 [Nitrososphaeraceae archaeon]|nr:cytochrome P450 [Nitrososphaeraceae archaeon]